MTDVERKADERTFAGCPPRLVAREVQRALRECRLPEEAERDVESALVRVPAESQALLIQAAVDARLAESSALARLACLMVTAASVNLADDLADRECDYLEPRVAPGVSFLLQAWAAALAARGSVSPGTLDEFWSLLVQAAAGQSLEVRTDTWTAGRYQRVAELIAGKQYAAYFRLLWDGSPLGAHALAVGERMGSVGIVLSDVLSEDPRFFELPAPERKAVLAWCRGLLAELGELPGLAARDFVELASKPLRGAEPRG